MTELHIPLTERLKSIPETFGIRMHEEPEYDIIKQDGHFEIRHYEKQLVAKISMQGMTFDSFREAAFEKLANYIFEGNEEQKSIPMTSPVMEQHGTGVKTPRMIPMTSPVYQQENEPGGWTMSFILPEGYTLATAPAPKDPAIVLEEIPPFLAACICYTGNNTLENIKEHERQLAQWLKKQPNIQTTERYMVAQYDAPFVIPFLKKNEIQVRIDNMF